MSQNKSNHRVLVCPQCFCHATVTSRYTRLICASCNAVMIEKPKRVRPESSEVKGTVE